MPLTFILEVLKNNLLIKDVSVHWFSDKTSGLKIKIVVQLNENILSQKFNF